jgi:twitching motility protein PilT
METFSKENLNQLLSAMIQSHDGISDLLFVSGKAPQVETHGKLKTFAVAVTEAPLTSERIEALAMAILDANPKAAQDLADHGSCDCSYSLGDACRFRVNIFRQNGNYAMVLRRLQTQIPSLAKLNLPPIFNDIIAEKNGIIFVTGGTGSGKTTTLAALLNEINLTSEVHIVTLEDPIEFLHPHIKATFSQREFKRDFFSFPSGLRAALRQAPKVILVGEIRDRETMEIALTAAETGHVVYSTLHTISAGQTINRILGMFSKEEEEQVRQRLAETLRFVVSQRLVPKTSGGRILVTEIMGNSMRSREAIVLGEGENRRFLDIIEGGNTAGWHSFEQSLLKAYKSELITEETALLYCTNKSQMRQRLDNAKKCQAAGPEPSSLKMKTEGSASKLPIRQLLAAKLAQHKTPEAKPG